MSFSYSAGGSRDETVSSLAKAPASDGFGSDLRDLLVKYLKEAADTPGLRYKVNAHGHSGAGSLLTLSATVGKENAE